MKGAGIHTVDPKFHIMARDDDSITSIKAAAAAGEQHDMNDPKCTHIDLPYMYNGTKKNRPSSYAQSIDFLTPREGRKEKGGEEER